MMSDEDELYIKVVVLDEIYNFVVKTFFEIIWINKYASQDFIELIANESICSIVTNECVVLGKGLGWTNNQNQGCRYQKVMQLCSS